MAGNPEGNKRRRRMNRLSFLLAAILATGAVVTGDVSANTSQRIGGGVHYWVAVEDIALADIDDDGVGWYLSYQLRPAMLLTFELDVEMLLSDYAGSGDDVYSPQAFVLVGSTIYAGLGIGTYYADGELADTSFFMLRAGLDLELLPALYLDISAQYRFDEWDEISEAEENIDTDTVTLGAVLRLEL
jgi:hypothetical protein